MGSVIFIVILALLVIGLLVYNYTIHKKIETYTKLSERIEGFNVLQEFMNALSDTTSIQEKLDSMNDTIITKFNIKYSTIVSFDGSNFKVRTSNVDKNLYSTLENLQNEPCFSDAIKEGKTVYLTVKNETDNLPYQKVQFNRAKSALFFPIYLDNIFLGYWLIEGSKPNEFQDLDNSLLQIIRSNIVTILRTVENQATLENLSRDDLYSGLKTGEYLYGEGKTKIDQYSVSSLCMIKIVNLPEINLNISRQTGDAVVRSVSEVIKKNISQNYIVVRFRGPKFCIVFTGADIGGVVNFSTSIKAQIESLKVSVANDYFNSLERLGVALEDEQIKQIENTLVVSPRVKIAISQYAKGVRMDQVLKKLENYIDSSDKLDITTL